jgi:hypothetical protein
VEYFDYGSSDDGGGGVDVGAGARGDRGAGKGKNSVAVGEAAQVRDEEPRSQPSYLLGSRPVSAPWMHGQERHSTVDRLVSDKADDGEEEEADRHSVFDDELGSVEEDEEWADNVAVLEEEPIAEDLLEGELYEDEDPASPTANSSIQPDSVLDRGSTGSGFDTSARRSSVSSIVNTLRNSMEESGPSATIGRPDAEDFVQKLGPVLLPWEREDVSDGGMRRKHTNAELAERTIPEPELRRLRDVALRMKERMRVGPGGVTQTIVETIHSKWKVDEVVKMRFEGPPSLNMKRTHELLEVPIAMAFLSSLVLPCHYNHRLSESICYSSIWFFQFSEI